MACLQGCKATPGNPHSSLRDEELGRWPGSPCGLRSVAQVACFEETCAERAGSLDRRELEMPHRAPPTPAQVIPERMTCGTSQCAMVGLPAAGLLRTGARGLRSGSGALPTGSSQLRTDSRLFLTGGRPLLTGVRLLSTHSRRLPTQGRLLLTRGRALRTGSSQEQTRTRARAECPRARAARRFLS